MSGARAAVERFLQSARKPALLEPGEDLIPLNEGSFVLEMRQSRLTLQAWDEKRNIVRRIVGVHSERSGKLELVVEKFARREGRVALVDLAHPQRREWERRGTRLVFRERLRELLARQFPDYTAAELSAEPNLEHSLSPVYPRALLKRGQSALAAILAPPEADPAAMLSFGLIWLDYLRRRTQRTPRPLVVEGLALFAPAGRERDLALRMRFLDGAAARFELFSYEEHGYAARRDLADCGNVETKLDPCRRPPQANAHMERLSQLPDVQIVENGDESASLRVRGIEFARTAGRELLFGLGHRAAVRDYNLQEVETLAAEIAALRAPHAANRENPLYRGQPESWLEALVRADIERVDASLRRTPLYGQVPAMAGMERGVMDLLAVDHAGRLAVLELKASADLHLPLQALDYWLRVEWHRARGDFGESGYFPGIALLPAPPRLLLVSPALEFHSTTEAILSYFAPQIPVERIGLGMNWRSGLEVMFRAPSSQRPDR